MSPLFMECQLNSPVLLPAEESNTVGPERGVKRKRQEKNRDAARKSRKKQTERADELHEELQSLERSNSALIKEIDALKKEFELYTMALERHKPFCRLKDSASSCSPPHQLTASPSANQTSSCPPGVPPQPSDSTFATSPPTSSTSDLGHRAHGCFDSKPLSPPAPPPGTTTLASASGSSPEPFSSSGPIVPDPVLFSMAPAHSLFSDAPLITSTPTNAQLICTSVVSHPVSSSCLPVAAAQPHSGHGSIHDMSCLSPLHSDTLDEFLMTQDSFLTAANELPPYPHSAEGNTGLVVTGSAINPHTSSSQDSALQPLSPAASACYSRPDALSGVSLLSLLTVPSPPNMSPTTSSSFDELLPQHPPSMPLSGQTSGDLSLSDFLENNDWILNGTTMK